MLGLFALSSSLRGPFVNFIVFFSLILKPTFVLMCCPHDNNYYSKIVSCRDVMILGLLLHCTVFILLFILFFFCYIRQFLAGIKQEQSCNKPNPP